MRTGLVEIHRVVRRVLVIPADLAASGVKREHAVGVEIVARPVRAVVFRRWISRTPIGRIGGRVVGAGDVERAAAGLPGIVLVLPGLAAGLAGRRHGVSAPKLVAGLAVERHQPIAHALIAARCADQNRVLERQRRGVERHIRLVAQVLVPDDLAGLLVGRDDSAVVAGDRDDEVAPQRDAAVAVHFLLAGVHLPDGIATRAGANIDLVDDAPGVAHIHEPVVDQRRRQQVFVAAFAADRNGKFQLQILDIGLVDLVER